MVPQKWQVPCRIQNGHGTAKIAGTVPYTEWARYRKNCRYRAVYRMGTVPQKWQVPCHINNRHGTAKLEVPCRIQNGHGTAKIAGTVPYTEWARYRKNCRYRAI